jgi:predicted permease
MDIFFRASLLFVAVALGIILKRQNIIKHAFADKLLWFIFWVGLPFTIVGSILSIPLQGERMILPVIGFAISTCCMLIAYIISRVLRLPRKLAGVLICASMIMNTNFSISFIGAWYGQEGVALFSLFDLGNILSLFILAYPIALAYGGRKIPLRQILVRTLTVPTVWAIFFALALNLQGFFLPQELKYVTRYGSFAVFLTVMFTLGLFIQDGLHLSRLLWVGLATRFLLGGFLGYLATQLFNLEGLARAVVLIAAVSPNGYTTLVYAKIAKLDHKYAASLVSVSLLIGLIAIPLMLLFFS